MKRLLILAVVIVIVGGVAVGAYLRTRDSAVPEVTMLPVTRGEVVQVVGATGTLEAVTTVDVATQVTGVVKEMYADFNSIVRKGDLIARIDPASIEAAIERDKANLESQMANLERQDVAVQDAKSRLRRAEGLFAQKLLTVQDLEAAQVAVKTAEASLRSQEASIKQIRAQLNQDQVNLGYTSIYAPISGIVINRKVDIGQTVVSNNMATSLYQIAQDLTDMQLKVSIDEAEVGIIRPGQPARFRVDAYPDREFTGTVAQVRLQPIVTQNVVTYTTIIAVPNVDLVLKPGMRTNANIEIARRDDVLRIPASALKFRATTDVFALLKLPLPDESQRRNQALARASVEIVSSDADTGAGIANRGATTVDALFGPLNLPESQGRVWVYVKNAETGARSLTPIQVRTGIADGTWAELVAGPGIEEGKMLVTGIAGTQTSTTWNPLMPGRGGFRGGPGGDHGPH